MPTLHVLKVFLGPGDIGGNLLGVFLYGPDVPRERRQAVALDLGFSETVFVDQVDGDRAQIAIFTPTSELPFAGHPSVGSSWLLAQVGRPVSTLQVSAGDVGTWHDADMTWIRARPEWVFPLEAERLASPAEVEAIREAPPGKDSWYPWAWIDETAGVLRSRYFAQENGIVEDEATGAAAVWMGGLLGRPLTIRQGAGSELHVRPGPDGTVEVGGRTTQSEVRPYTI